MLESFVEFHPGRLQLQRGFQTVRHLRPPTDDAADLFLDVDERFIHRDATIDFWNRQSKRLAPTDLSERAVQPDGKTVGGEVQQVSKVRPVASVPERFVNIQRCQRTRFFVAICAHAGLLFPGREKTTPHQSPWMKQCHAFHEHIRPPKPGEKRTVWIDGIVLARRYVGPMKNL
jgi:hypothetical protein